MSSWPCPFKSGSHFWFPSLTEDGGVCKCNIYILKERKPLLQKYIDDNASLEIQAVYAVQALFVQLDHPPSKND